MPTDGLHFGVIKDYLHAIFMIHIKTRKTEWKKNSSHTHTLNAYGIFNNLLFISSSVLSDALWQDIN